MFLQFIRNQVDNVTATVGQQQQVTSNVLADVARKLVPAMMELIAAIGGINLNLGKATGIVDQADSKAKGMADNLGELFSQI
jgi:hypothetical protein